MTDYVLILIKCLCVIAAGVFAGNGAVYFFNRIPPQWLCEYGEEPSEELKDRYTQRVKSYPWKYVFTMLFIICGIWLVMENWQFTIAAVPAMWLLLEIAIADYKYRIIPDQLVILLAVTAAGFVPFHGGIYDCIAGAAAGFGITFATALLGKLFYRRDAVGGGDIKLFAALGLMSGLEGILTVFVLTTIISAGHVAFLTARRKLKRGDTVAMGPYIVIAAGIYIMFLWGRLGILFA